MRKPLLIIDHGHGGRDSGATAEYLVPKGELLKHRTTEAQLVRIVGLPLLEALRKDRMLEVLTSHEIANRRINDDFSPMERKAALEIYNCEYPISLVVSLHFNASSDASARGLVVCYSDQLDAAEAMYSKIISAASEKGIDLAGNRKERLQKRESLALLKADIKDALAKHGVSGKTADDLGKALNDSLESYKDGLTTLENAIISPLRGFLASAEIGLVQSAELAQELAQRAEKYGGCAVLFAKDQKPLPLALAGAGSGRHKFIPALLVEMGFITNATDRQVAIEKPQIFAEGIKQGVYEILLTANQAVLA